MTDIRSSNLEEYSSIHFYIHADLTSYCASPVILKC